MGDWAEKTLIKLNLLGDGMACRLGDESILELMKRNNEKKEIDLGKYKVYDDVNYYNKQVSNKHYDKFAVYPSNREGRVGGCGVRLGEVDIMSSDFNQIIGTFKLDEVSIINKEYIAYKKNWLFGIRTLDYDYGNKYLRQSVFERDKGDLISVGFISDTHFELVELEKNNKIEVEADGSIAVIFIGKDCAAVEYIQDKDRHILMIEFDTRKITDITDNMATMHDKVSMINKNVAGCKIIYRTLETGKSIQYIDVVSKWVDSIKTM